MTASDDLTPELDQLANQWLQERERKSGSDAWYRGQDLAQERPNDAWRLALALIKRAGLESRPVTLEEEGLRSGIASFPEYILTWHAESFVDRVEAEASHNELFRDLLSRVMLSDDVAPAPILQRLKVASGGRLRVYPAPGSELGRVAFDVCDEYRSNLLPSIPAAVQFPIPLLAREIEHRCPGRTSAEYAIAAERGLHWSR